MSNNIIIKEQQAREAKSIIETSNRTQDGIKSLLDTMDQNKKVLVSWKEELERLKDAAMPEQIKEEELNKIMNRYDVEINRMQKDLNPLLVQMEDLKKRSHTLYTILKEEWPGYSDDELKKALQLAIINLI